MKDDTALLETRRDQTQTRINFVEMAKYFFISF